MVVIDLSINNGYVDYDKLKAEVDFVIFRVGCMENKQTHTIAKRFFKYYKGAKRIAIVDIARDEYLEEIENINDKIDNVYIIENV